MKTVHGVEFYANKKHKGSSHDTGNNDDGNQHHTGFDSSPRSEDMHSGKTASLSSPSIKSESEANSPSQPPVNSPMGVSHLISGGHEDFDCVSSNVAATPLGTNVSAIDDPSWPYEDEDLEVADLPVVLRAMVGIGGPTGSGGNTAQPATISNPRNRFRSRLQAKSINALSNIPEINRCNIGIGELNQRITELKMEPGVPIPPKPLQSQNPNTQLTDLQSRLQPPNTNIQNQIIRRDSNNSNASTYYCSMRSADASRRSSQASQLSSISTMRPSGYNSSSFYDPISPGCSRRSSQMSMTTTGGQSLPPPPSSHLISSHLQRLQGVTNSGRHSIPNIPTQSFNVTNMQRSDRRQSEPVNQSYDRMLLSPLPLQPLSPSKTSKPTNSNALATRNTPRDHHPNEEVVLDEVEEGEMVENKLVIPDEMLQYLNQVADNGDISTHMNNTQQNQQMSTSVCFDQTTNSDITNIPFASPAENSTNNWGSMNTKTDNQNLTTLYPNSPNSVAMVGSPQQVLSPQSGISCATNTSYATTTPQITQQSQPQLSHMQVQQQVQQQQPQLQMNNAGTCVQNKPIQQTMQHHQPVSQNNMNFNNMRPMNGGPMRRIQMNNHHSQMCFENEHQQQNANIANMRMYPSYQDHFNNSQAVVNNYTQYASNGNQQTTMMTNMMNAQQQQQHPQHPIACLHLPGYYHRTDLSAGNCCSSQPVHNNVAGMTPCPTNNCCDSSMTEDKNKYFFSQNDRLPTATNSIQSQPVKEIQCGDISQSQMSPATVPPPISSLQTDSTTMGEPMHSTIPSNNLAPTPNNNLTDINNTTNMMNSINNAQYSHNGMRQDTYQRTLEYVQNCQNWVEYTTDSVTSSTHPNSNMIINDMTTSLNSLLEENRFLQMIQ